ncbi:hypothetical protein ABG067_003847 [Albugo candida]|uniref:C2 domain-containing protein n=1 Tax=Albugo candida TaxID=65357 RepID=A0A024G8Z6_9STRA|nr:unnamed protein product [Albugo candida]|eukprot:CCI43144.1 unnamed protein product [Albugo candida]
MQKQLHLEPFLYEKHVDHQDGVAGHLSIRLLEAKNLVDPASMFWKRTCNPYVIFRIGNDWERSTTIRENNNPTWRREMHKFAIKKINKKNGPIEEHSNVRLELIIDVMSEDSFTGRATECVGITNGSLIGTASVDITSLLEGYEEVMDRWFTLGGALPATESLRRVQHPHQELSLTHARSHSTGSMEKQIRLGEIRLVLQYEPFGMEPLTGDVLRWEGFGIYPSSILPPMEDLELFVEKMSGNHLYCSYKTISGYEGHLRVHRNNIFVAHRTSIFDRVYVNLIASPLEFFGNTPLGKSCREIARPYTKVAMAFSWPAIMAAKTAFTTTMRATSAAAGAVLATYTE